MNPTRRALLVGACAAAVVPSGCGGGWRSGAREALTRGAAALWSLQGPDGAFRSTRYGLFAEGWSLTPFALLALLRSGEAAPIDRLSRGLGWIAHGTRDGRLGLASLTPDYPCYATALALHVWSIVRPPDGEALRTELDRGLRSFQLRATDGWAGHAAEGGFRMGSSDVPQPPHPGHVDLSMTRRAVEALVAAGAAPTDPALVEAAGFAVRCGTPEGGFVYTATETALNKGRRDGADPAYGSATADGLLTLLATGASGERVDRGLAALRAMHRVDENPRVGDGPLRPYGPAMRGYYRSAAGRVFRRAGGPDGWERALVEAVLAEQRADGTWSNDAPEQKEDDPVIATGFALEALAAAIGVGKD